jgi:hypothetical protein
LAVKKSGFGDAGLVNANHEMAQVQAAENGNKIEGGNQEVDKLHAGP